jgi:hypothetical protein
MATKFLRTIRLTDRVTYCSRLVEVDGEMVKCGHKGRRHHQSTRQAHTIGGTLRFVVATYYCSRCRRHFTHPGLRDYVEPTHRHSTQLIRRVVGYARAHGPEKALRYARKELGHDIAPSTMYGWLAEDRWDDVPPLGREGEGDDSNIPAGDAMSAVGESTE